MASPNDTTYSIVRETIPGVTNATPAFVTLDYLSGSDLAVTGKMLTSDTIKKNRALAGASLINKAGGGSLKCHARRDSTVDLLIEGAIGGAFTAGVATGGSTDFSHTVEKLMVEKSSGTPVNNYFRWSGAYVSKMGLTVDASSNAEFSFDFVTKSRVESLTQVTGATYADAVQGDVFNGANVGTITIAGLTGIYTSLELSIEQAREAIFGLGSVGATSVGNGASSRMVKLTAKMIRNGIAVDALAGTTVSVEFTVGAGTNNQYKFTLPKCVVNIPTDEVSGASAIVNIEFMAVAPLATDFDIKVTKS